MPTLNIALAMPFWLEYTNLLVEGAVSYIKDFPEIRIAELPIQGEPWALAGVRPFPYDGVLTFANLHTDRWILDLHRDGIPIVNCSADFIDQSLPCVLGGSCASVAADYLVDLGRESVGFVYGCEAADAFVKSHYDALLKAVPSHAFEVQRFAHQPSKPDLPFEYLADPENEKALAHFLQKLPRPASVWCLSDYLGVLVIRVARSLGLDVPGELAVLGVGAYRIGRVADPPLSTIPVPGEQIGAKGMSLLHAIALGKAPKDSGTFVIPCPPVLEQGSTRRALTTENIAGRADALMRQHANEGITVNEIAAMLSISRVTLTRHFQAAFNASPGERLRQYRLEQAKQWLSVDGLNVARIAGMCGFSEQGKFSNFFKRETGMSPTAFRRATSITCPDQDS